MIVRGVVVLALLVSGLLVSPATATPAGSSVSAVSSLPAAAAAPGMSVPMAKKKPRAQLSGYSQVRASGKVRVKVTSNAKKVKLTYRTKKNKKRFATIKVRRGQGAKTLRKGSKKIYARAKATNKLRKSKRVRVRPAVPPVVTPPPVTPPVVTPPPVATPPVTPPPVADVTAPGPVAGLTVTDATESRLSLSWTLPGDADLAAVLVRRAAGRTAPASATSGAAVSLSGAVASSVTDSGLAPGAAYSYAVFTRDVSGNTSAGVTVIASTEAAPDWDAPATPIGVQAVGRDQAVDVSWSHVGDADLAGYRVYRSQGPDGPWVSTSPAPILGTSLAVDGLDNDTQYWVQVTAVDTTGNESAPSLPTSGVPATDPVPPAVTTLITPNEATVVQAGGFQAAIPPGTVSDPGIAVTVTPLPWEDGQLPSVDVHIHGPWDPAAGGIGITSPWPFEEAQSPIVLHDALDGLRISSGSAVRLAGRPGERTASVTATSLSRYSYSYVECNSTSPEQRKLMVGCSDLKDVLLNTYWQSVADRLWEEALARAQALAGQPCGASDGNVALIGEVMTDRMSCALAEDQGVGTYRFTNTSDRDVLLWDSPSVISHTQNGGPVDMSVDDDRVPWILTALRPQGNDGFLLPGGVLTVDKQGNSSETDLTMRLDRSRTIAAIVTMFALGQLGDAALNAPQTTPVWVMTNLAKCYRKDLSVAWVDCFLDAMVDVASHALGTKFPPVKAVLLGLDVTFMAGTIAEAFEGRAATTHLINSTPTTPPTNQGGLSWIARNPDNGRSVLVVGTTARPIVDGGTFECLASTRIVWDIPTLAVLRSAIPEPAGCSNDGRAAWDIRPAPQGNTGTGVILRHSEQRAWLVTDAGDLQTLTDTSNYRCAAALRPVIWTVPTSAIDAWQPAPAAAPSCVAEAPLPAVALKPFAKAQPSLGAGWSVVSPTSDGWWLVVGQDLPDNGVNPLEWTYKWIGPDGRDGPSWTSAYNAATNYVRAIPGKRGEVYLVAFTADPFHQVLFRVGANGFGASLDLGFDGRNPFSGSLAFGTDGNLYWNTSDPSRQMWVNRIDPDTLTVTGRVRITSETPLIQATTAGIVAYTWYEGVWTIPYEAFTTANGQTWNDKKDALLNAPYVRPSIGQDGALAVVTDPLPQGGCDTYDAAYRAANSSEWHKNLVDLVGQPLTNCLVVDIDARPAGGVIFTMRGDEGIFLLEVSAGGQREGWTRLDDPGANATTMIDDTGLVVTSYTRPLTCPGLPPDDKCSEVVLLARRDGTEVYRDTWASPGQPTKDRVAHLGHPSMFLAAGQIGVYITYAAENPCGATDNCYPYGDLTLSTKLLGAQLPVKPPNAHW